MENTTQPAQITIEDLNVLKGIIDLASSRGAFRGSELTMVGTTYDKLALFLEAVIAQARAQEQAELSDTTNPQGE